MKVGLIGCGGIAPLHIRVYERLKDTEVVGLCDLNEERARTLAKRFHVDRTYKDYWEMFEKENSKDGNIESYLDSELIVKQLNGEYRIKNEGLKPLYEKVSSLKKHFNSIKFIHIPREKNKLADKLVNRELDAHE